MNVKSAEQHGKEAFEEAQKELNKLQDPSQWPNAVPTIVCVLVKRHVSEALYDFYNNF